MLLSSRISHIVNFAGYAFILFCWYQYLLDISYDSQGSLAVDLKLKFTQKDFAEFMQNATQIGIICGGMSLAFAALMTLYKNLCPSDIDSRHQGYFQKFVTLINSLIYIWIASVLFLVSIPIFTRGVGQPSPTIVNEKLQMLPPEIGQNVQELHLISSYGLFRRMTGVGGRPEVIIEGSDSLNGPWKEYHFMYKPGNLSQAPQFVLPHQPRLDWQMWFAALGSYEHNPWFISLLYRLLESKI